MAVSRFFPLCAKTPQGTPSPSNREELSRKIFYCSKSFRLGWTEFHVKEKAGPYPQRTFYARGGAQIGRPMLDNGKP